VLIYIIFTGDLNIAASDVQVNSIIFMWNATNSSFCGGIVYYQVVLFSDGEIVNSTSTTELSIKFDNLMANTTYTVMVSSFNDAGENSPARMVATTNELSSGMQCLL